MNNQPKKGLITGIFICLAIYFIVSILFLYRYVLFSETENSMENLTYMLLIQNAVIGIGFLISYICFINKTEKNEFASPFASLIVMTEAGQQVEEVTLYNIHSLSVALKDKGNLLFGNTETDNSYVQQYAVLNLVSGYWYIESLTGKCPVGIKKENESMVYRLKAAMPYKLSYHDIIYVDSYKILVQ